MIAMRAPPRPSPHRRTAHPGSVGFVGARSHHSNPIAWRSRELPPTIEVFRPGGQQVDVLSLSAEPGGPGITITPSYVAEPECHGVIERCMIVASVR